MCNCKNFGALVDISNSYSEFTKSLVEISFNNWLNLMKCSACQQLWLVEEWDKYQSIYAAKIDSELNWENFDFRAKVKEKIVQNRGGLSTSKCLHAGCLSMQVKTSFYCVHHLYEAGTRA